MNTIYLLLGSSLGNRHQTLREAGIKKALAGITSLEEVLTSTLTYE